MRFRLLAAVLAVACAPAAASAQDRYVFGDTESEAAPRATLLLDGITPFVSTNTGWYNEFGGHDASNPNYLTGSFSGSNRRSFFSFALEALSLASPYQTAVLTIKAGTTSDPSTLPLVLTLRSVAASTVDLAADRGLADPNGAAIYADLGDGTSYGSYTFAAPTAVGDTVSITLNAAFLNRLNAGLLRDFSFGGALGEAAPAGVPEPATWALALLGFGAAGTAMRRRRVGVAFAA